MFGMEGMMKKKIHVIIVLSLLCMILGAHCAHAGWVKNGSRMEFIDSSGVKRSSVYYAKKKLGFVQIGTNYYAYSASGKRIKGWVKIGSDRYYFKKSNGRQIRGRAAKIKKKYYFFDADGKALRSTWHMGYYYGRSGARLVNSTKVFNGVTYSFDAAGNATGKTQSGTSVDAGYVSDPQVTDEVLLSAIIYTEAGNQPYYGQLAVGLVITNRMRSAMAPNTLREVLYQTEQFQPARSGILTTVLRNQNMITASCKKAAKEVLRMYKKNRYKINVNGKKVSMKGYLFFMTPAAFQRLGIKSAAIQLQGHMFFKQWVR